MPAAIRIHHLLVVDDDLLVCELLTQLLRGEGFAVTAAGSAEIAVQLLQRAAPACNAVLTDLQMPGLSGLELAQRLRAMNDPPLLIGMSARPPNDLEQQAFDAFLQKPFTLVDLQHVLDATAPSSEMTRDDRAAGYQNATGNTPLPETGSIPAGTQLPQTDPRKSVSAGRPDTILDPEIFRKLRAAVGPTQLAQLYEMTANDVDSRLLLMRGSLRIGDAAAVRSEAHAIKGGCSMVGALELSRLAARAELGSETDTKQLDEIAEACMRLRQVVTIVPP